MMSDKSRDRVLIADDNEANVELLEAYLADMDVELAAFDPHLILLDVMMPKLSGFEVCQKLKSDPRTVRIMILMVTALNEHGDMERGVESGADDFLSKPVNKEALIKRVQLMLKLRNVTDELERLRRYIEEMEEAR
jgi:two-component system alkaline phosphatase synthesis response regulator PhoP